MHTSRAGFTLVEVLVAIIVSTVGISALLSTLAASAALAGDGGRMGRAAVVLASRADELRARVAAAAPECLAPPAGSTPEIEGITETWSASRRGNVIDLVLEAKYRRGGRPVADTFVTAASCP